MAQIINPYSIIDRNTALRRTQNESLFLNTILNHWQIEDTEKTGLLY